MSMEETCTSIPHLRAQSAEVPILQAAEQNTPSILLDQVAFLLLTFSSSPLLLIPPPPSHLNSRSSPPPPSALSRTHAHTRKVRSDDDDDDGDDDGDSDGDDGEGDKTDTTFFFLPCAPLRCEACAAPSAELCKRQRRRVPPPATAAAAAAAAAAGKEGGRASPKHGAHTPSGAQASSGRGPEAGVGVFCRPGPARPD